MARPDDECAAASCAVAGITQSGMGMGSVPFEVLIGARTRVCPGSSRWSRRELQIETKQRPLADVADAWSSPEPQNPKVG